MFRKAVSMTKQDGPPFVHVDLFGGRGQVRVWNLLDRAAEPFTAVLSCELDPNGAVGPHQQLEFPEVVIGVGGAGEATVDGQRFPMGAGTVVHLPLGSVLAITNTSATEPLRYLIIKARG
jgi:quercetin dioxygenase-like cupin family protein